MQQRQRILPVRQAAQQNRGMSIAARDRNGHTGDAGALAVNSPGVGTPSAWLAELVGDTQGVTGFRQVPDQAWIRQRA